MKKTPCWSLIFILAGVGCGGIGEVSGHVKKKGEAVTAGWILIVGKDGLPHRAQIQEDGSYLVKEVPTGEAKVGVIAEQVGPKKEKQTVGMPADPQEAFKLIAQNRPEPRNPNAAGPKKANETRIAPPKALGNPLESGLTCTVKRGGNVFDINLD